MRIKDLRDERGLSQRGFAALIGMSPTYLADIERGARNVSIDNMKRIADGFGVTFHERRKEWSRNAIPSTYVRWVS